MSKSTRLHVCYSDLGAWVAKATCQSLCNVKKNNKRLLIPAQATVTHTPPTMEKETRPRAPKLFWAHPQHVARPCPRGYPQGSAPWALMMNSKIVSQCPCESRCVQRMRAYHIYFFYFFAALAMRRVLQQHPSRRHTSLGSAVEALQKPFKFVPALQAVI